MRKWLIPVICLALVGSGGCGSKKNKAASESKPPRQASGPVDIELRTVNIDEAPDPVKRAVEQNKSRETACLLEDQGIFWVLVTRGVKPTGGYSVQVKSAVLTDLPDGGKKLMVTYHYKDPRPDQVVIQVLTTPMHLVLLKDLKTKPDQVEFLRK